MSQVNLEFVDDVAVVTTMNPPAELFDHGQIAGDAQAASLGRLGRSQGCPALSPVAAARVIALTRDGTVVFAYYRT